MTDNGARALAERLCLTAHAGTDPIENGCLAEHLALLEVGTAGPGLPATDGSE